MLDLLKWNIVASESWSKCREWRRTQGRYPLMWTGVEQLSGELVFVKWNRCIKWKISLLIIFQGWPLSSKLDYDSLKTITELNVMKVYPFHVFPFICKASALLSPANTEVFSQGLASLWNLYKPPTPRAIIYPCLFRLTKSCISLRYMYNPG